MQKVRGTCYFLGNSHLDAAWLWPFSETIDVFHDTCETVLKLMEEYHDFRFCQSSAQYYEWLEKTSPETFEKVKKKVAEGRWEIVGGMWVEPDGNILSGESMVRQLLHGKRYFKKKFNVDVKVAWMPDSFGYAWTLPQIMKKSGIRFFLTTKMNWNDTTVFPHYFFNWTAPDGSSVFSHQTVGAYDEAVSETKILEQMKKLDSRHQLEDLLYLFGTGDHGGGVTEDMIKNASEFVHGQKPVKGVFSKSEEYFNALSKKIEEKNLPEINDELYFEFHRGTYTTQAKVKKNNRKAECLLETAEKFSTIARRFGCAYPRTGLKEAWQTLLLNQFHDVLPGSSIPQVYKDSEKCFELIFQMVDSMISKSLKTIATKVNTEGKGESLLVFNPLSWARTDIVEMSLNVSSGDLTIYDERGQKIHSQVLDRDGKLMFVAENVPSVGYKQYRVEHEGHGTQASTSLFSEESETSIKLENEFFTVKVDKKTGLLTSVFDKSNNKEILKDLGNRIQVFEDCPVMGRTSVNSRVDAQIFDAWEVYIYQQPGGTKYIELRNPIEVKLVENGPVRLCVQVKYRYAQEGRPDSTFIVRTSLCHKIPLVQFSLHVDWRAKHRLAKVAFPLDIHSDFTTYEIPYGFITRRNPNSKNATSAERAKYEVPGLKWVDHTSENGEYGVSLLNDCKYGFDSTNDTVRMSLLRSAGYPIRLRAAFGLSVDENDLSLLTDQGEHDIIYALYPHRSDFKQALTTKKANEFNLPLIPTIEPNHEGSLPKTHSFLSVQPANVILNVIKKAEDSDALILRLYETDGKNAKATIAVNETLKSAQETDLLENATSEIPVNGYTLKIPISKHEIKTLKILQK